MLEVLFTASVYHASHPQSLLYSVLQHMIFTYKTVSCKHFHKYSSVLVQEIQAVPLLHLQFALTPCQLFIWKFIMTIYNKDNVSNKSNYLLRHLLQRPGFPTPLTLAWGRASREVRHNHSFDLNQKLKYKVASLSVSPFSHFLKFKAASLSVYTYPTFLDIFTTSSHTVISITSVTSLCFRNFINLYS